MTALAAQPPPWVQPYEPDFRELLRRLDLTPGFIFQPVVLPSPDLARALAAWLASEGVDVRVFDLCHEPWDDLAARLLAVTFDPAAELRAVVVVTPNELDRAAVRDGLVAFNSIRDTLARALQSPLLWCGSVDLLRLTADHATDFWSIAAPVYRIPLRALTDVPSRLGFPRVWWTGAGSEGVEDLAARLAAARGRDDGPVAAKAGLDLAEAQLAHDQRSDAAETLAAIEPTVRTDAPSLVLRWRALDDAIRAANVSSSDAITELQALVARARDRGATRVEASLQTTLARLLRAAGRAAESFEALLAARSLFVADGDDAATAAIESLITVNFPDKLSSELTAEIRARAESLAHGSNNATIRGHAWTTCAALARHEQRWDDADAAAAAILRELSADDLGRLLPLHLQSDAAAARGDWDAVVAKQSELLDIADAHGIAMLAHDAHHARAHALTALGRHRDACDDANAARVLAARLGDHRMEALHTLDMSEAARRLGAGMVGQALAARVFARFASNKGKEKFFFNPELIAHVRDSDSELANLLAAFTGDPTGRTADLLRDLADAREQSLRARGVDLLGPDTWPNSAPA